MTDAPHDPAIVDGAAQRSRASRTFCCAWSSPAASCVAMWRHCSTMARSRSLREALVVFEREYVTRELARYAGHRLRTAAALGITRQALAAKMARLGL